MQSSLVRVPFFPCVNNAVKFSSSPFFYFQCPTWTWTRALLSFCLWLWKMALVQLRCTLEITWPNAPPGLRLGLGICFLFFFLSFFCKLVHRRVGPCLPRAWGAGLARHGSYLCRATGPAALAQRKTVGLGRAGHLTKSTAYARFFHVGPVLGLGRLPRFTCLVSFPCAIGSPGNNFCCFPFSCVNPNGADGSPIFSNSVINQDMTYDPQVVFCLSKRMNVSNHDLWSHKFFFFKLDY